MKNRHSNHKCWRKYFESFCQNTVSSTADTRPEKSLVVDEENEQELKLQVFGGYG
jgi:hypothetical protein